METLKIKFKLHALEYEVEGQQETAKEEFKNFNENILTQLLSKVNITLSNQTISNFHRVNEFEELPESIVTNSKSEIDLSSHPTLKDVKLRDLAKNEVDWLLLYAFYASNFGTKEFTRDQILDLYKETDRRTDIRIKNLSQYLKLVIKAEYIKSTNDTNFIILPKGKTRATEILGGKSPAKEYSRTVKKSDVNNGDKNIERGKKSKTASPLIQFTDLKFEINEMKSLKDFFISKSAKTQNDEVAVVLQWYQKEKNGNGATLEEINYLIKISTNNVPSSLGQVLINMKGPKLSLIEKDKMGKYKLTSLGELHADKLTKTNS